MKKRNLALIIESFKEFIGDSEYFINIGRLDKQKNQEELIKQFDEFINETGGNYKLVIIGSGILKDSIEELIAEKHLSEKVMLLPYISNPFPYLRGALAFVLASIYEGLPNALLEAMALGVPVITSDCPTVPRELLLDKNDINIHIKEIEVTERGIIVGTTESKTGYKYEGIKKH